MNGWVVAIPDNDLVREPVTERVIDVDTEYDGVVVGVAT